MGAGSWGVEVWNEAGADNWWLEECRDGWSICLA